LNPDDIEQSVREWQVERAALVNVDLVFQASQPIQQHRAGTVIGGHLEAIDAAADRVSEQPGATSQPGSDIEYMLLGMNLRRLQQFDRSLKATGMEVVEGPSSSGDKRCSGCNPAARMPARIRASMSRAE